jgi:hypothetical protein
MAILLYREKMDCKTVTFSFPQILNKRKIRRPTGQSNGFFEKEALIKVKSTLTSNK